MYTEYSLLMLCALVYIVFRFFLFTPPVQPRKRPHKRSVRQIAPTLSAYEIERESHDFQPDWF